MRAARGSRRPPPYGRRLLGASVVGAAISVLLTVFGELDPPDWLLFAAAIPAALILFAAGVLKAAGLGTRAPAIALDPDLVAADAERIRGLNRVITAGAELQSLVRDDPTLTESRAWTRYQRWHADAQDWLQWEAPRYSHLYRRCPAAADRIGPAFEVLEDAIECRLDALHDIRARIVRRDPLRVHRAPGA